MKKVILLLLLLTLSITLYGCDNTPSEINCDETPEHESCQIEPEDKIDYLDIYYLNDLHGAIEQTENQLGLSYIANLFITKKEANPDNTIILAGGDMISGANITDFYYGLSTVEMMNEMYFDAYVIGNHEFDWGLDGTLRYIDGVLHNGEMNYPLLAANIFLKGTNEHPKGIVPYEIIERAGFKIGIIGTIEYGLEYAINNSKVEDYEFTDPVEAIKINSEHLRTVENCDIVLVISHDSGFINDEVSQLTGTQKIDAIFNGHSKEVYARLDLGIPEIHTRLDGEYVGYVRINLLNDEINNYEVAILTDENEDLLKTENSDVKEIIDYYVAATEGLFDTIFLQSGKDYELLDLTKWVSKNIVATTDVDIAFYYYRGTKDSYALEEQITKANIYQFIPYNTNIQLFNLKGSQIKDIIKVGNIGFYTDTVIYNDVTYQVAVNEYLLERTEYPFGDNIIVRSSGVLIRDLILIELGLQTETYEMFYITNPLLSNADTE